MVEENEVRKRLYQKYIEPTKRKRNKYIGVEIELPIVNLKKEAVDFEVVHHVTAGFMEYFGFKTLGADDEGNIYAASCENTGDILSFDCSYNNLELSMGKEKELNSIYKRFCNYYMYLHKAFEKYDYTLTGMGVNPYRIYNHNVPIENGRYRMLFHHLSSYPEYNVPMYFHKYPEYGMFSSASQVQLDVEYDELLLTLNTFSKLEPIKALLFNNSVLLGEQEDLLCCRDVFWENSTHGINPHNVGVYNCHFETIEDLQSYIESTSLYCVERGDKYINFRPVIIMDYYKKESVVGEYFDGKSYRKIEVVPKLSDIDYLRTFKFEDLTYRGTVEFRSVCCQPVSDCMTTAAFHVGLKEKIVELSRLLEKDHVIYHHGYNQSELRKLFIKRNMPGFINEDDLYELVWKIVKLAEKGLLKRGYGEEIYIAPLYERIKRRENPAEHMLNQIEAGKPIEEIICEYGNLTVIISDGR